MDRLDVMRLFIRVVETGSFSRTARAANLAQPTVSKQIAALEAWLGTQLLRRTSRGLSLTEAGREYYESALRVLEDVDAAEARIRRGHVVPSGRVRVAISAAIGRLYVLPRLHEFLERFPEIMIDFDISERHISLIEDGIDVAIRIGDLSDSSLMARRIGTTDVVTVASPAYLKANGTPKTPADLAAHSGVIFLFHGAPMAWGFNGADSVMPKEIFRTNDAEHLRAAVLAGIGIGHAAGWLFADDIAAGAVKPVLKGHNRRTYPINAVWSGARTLPGKVKVFIDFLAQICTDEPSLRIR